MKCNKCHEEMKLKEIEVGKDSAGNPVYNLYAFCYHCKTKVNIDKLKKLPRSEKKPNNLQMQKGKRHKERKLPDLLPQKILRLQYMFQQELRRSLPRVLFPVHPHQLLPTVRRKSPHQNLRKHLLRRKNLMLPAPARLKSLQRSVTVRMTLILMMTITTTFNQIK